MKENNNKRKERKKQLTIWLTPSLIESLDELKTEDNCESRSEFIEKSLQFYKGYLACNRDDFFLPDAITSMVKSIVNESANQQRTLLFSMAVEMAIMMNLVAQSSDIDENTLERLRGYCIKEVKKSNGMLKFEDVMISLK